MNDNNETLTYHTKIKVGERKELATLLNLDFLNQFGISFSIQLSNFKVKSILNNIYIEKH